MESWRFHDNQQSSARRSQPLLPTAACRHLRRPPAGNLTAPLPQFQSVVYLFLPSAWAAFTTAETVRAITSSPVQGPDHLCLDSPVSPGADGAKSCGLLASMRSPVGHVTTLPSSLPHPSLHSPPPVFSDLFVLSSELRRMVFSFASQAALITGVETDTPGARAGWRFLNWLQTETTMASSCCP